MLAAEIQPQDSSVRHTRNHKPHHDPNQRPIPRLFSSLLERISKRQGTQAFVQHLAGASIPGLEGTPADQLAGRVRGLDIEAYMLATREILRLTAWFRRAFQAEFE
jgi:hypothetical protein